MITSNITTVVFSPTESTKAVTTMVAEGLGTLGEELNTTCLEAQQRTFAQEDLVVFGIPVYGGRVPALAIERIKALHGSSTPAVLVAVYGNREYDDALLELKETIEENGFIAIAAGAFIAEHSIMHSVAKGRPDASDKIKIAEFAKVVIEKMARVEAASVLPRVTVKGNHPYKTYDGVPLKPQGDKSCTNCQICVNHCPVGAIPANNPRETDKNLCISCMRCIKVCPAHARHLNKMMLSVAEKAFAAKCSLRKEPEFFL